MSGEVLVVGGGVMGMASAAALAKRGLSVTVLERFQVGHVRGSSGGPTRIFCLAYPEERYARMAEPALAAWRVLEEDSGERLLVTTGGVDIGEHTHKAADALTSIGRSFEWLEPDEAQERWPGIRFSPGEQILFQPNAGVCYADRTVRACARLAIDRGAVIREDTPVRSLRVDQSGAVIVTEAGEELPAPVAIVTAGSWAGPLLCQVDIDLPLTPTVEQVSYFRLQTPSPLPTLIDWTTAVPATEGFQQRDPYAVPDPEHVGDIKVGLHVSGQAVDATDGPFDVDQGRLDEVKEWIDRRFEPLVETQPAHTCLYTRTPDHHFILDRRGPLVIGSPCSGHGFKFAPLFGEILADLATGTSTTSVNIDGFSSSRPSLA